MTAPNIVVIVSDQHNARVMGCAGDRVVRTPHLDALAASGVQFDSAYCGSPLCVPSRSTLMTGQSCSELSVWTNHCVLPSSVPTFAHSLTAAGYDTTLIGRMHFWGPDSNHGFAHRLVGDVSAPFGGGGWSVLDGLPDGTNRQERVSTAVSGAGQTGYQHYDADVTAAAVDWIAQRGQSRAAEPFCAVVGLLLPHNPYIAPEPLYEHYLPLVGVPAVPAEFHRTLHPAVRDWLGSRDVASLTPEEIRSARAAYYGLVTMVDEQVGQITRALDAAGLRDDTIVIYTSDHGDMAGELGMWWKSSCYDGAARVPLLASWPGRFPRGARIAAPASLTDLAPTLADLAGAPPLPAASGRALTPLLRGDALPAGARPEIYLENVAQWAPPARMVRRGRHKLVRHHGHDRPQLFDLDADPAEVRDLGDDPAHADVRDELDALAQADWAPDDILRTVDRHQREKALLTAWARAARPPEDGLWARAHDAGLNRVSTLLRPAEDQP